MTECGRAPPRRRWWSTPALALVAGTIAGCTAAPSSPGKNVIPVYVPLSGADAARGDAVLKVSALLNDLIESSGTRAATFRVIDSNLSTAEMARQLDHDRARTMLVAGGCDETERIWRYFEGHPPFTLSLFCELLGDRAAIEREDRLTNRVYWLGPSNISFVRGLAAYLRDPQPASGIPEYKGGTFIYPGEQEETLRDVVRSFEELSRDGLLIEAKAVPLSHVTTIVDYTATIRALSERAARSAPDRQFVYLQLPWLSTIEWMRQAAIVLGPSGFEKQRRDWFAPLDYLAADPQRSLTPFDISNVNVVTAQTATDFTAVKNFDTATQLRFGQGGSGLVTRIAADAMISLALATARGDAPDANAARDRFLEVVTPGPTKTKYTFTSLAAGLKAAAQGQAVDYNGLFATLDNFDVFGQIATGLQASVRRPLANGGSPVTVKVDPIFVDPLQGRSLDLARGLARGCLAGEAPPGTTPWASANVAAAFDRDPETGVVETSVLSSRAGVTLHLPSPIPLTGIFVHHFDAFSEATRTDVGGTMMWWHSAFPAGFDYTSVPPDGQVTFPTQPKGPWQGVDFSFAARPVQTIVLLANYDANDRATTLFGDIRLFAADEGYAGFCT